MKYPVAILPGWQNSEPQHWQSIWQQKHGYARVMQQDWMNPKRQDWVKRVEEFAANQPKKPILIAHSLGCNTVAILSAETRCRIAGAFLVAPVDLELPSTPPEVKGFLPTPQRILRFPSIVVASENDPYCSIERAKQFAESWGSKFINIGPHGHINTASGFGQWPEGEKHFNELIGFLTGT